MSKASFDRWYQSPKGRSLKMLDNAVINSKHRGMPPPEITREDIAVELEKGVCSVTGIPFVYGRDLKHSKHPFAPSIDRPDSTRPYTKDNFRIVCWAVNIGCASWGMDLYLEVAQKAMESRKSLNVISP